MSPKVGALHHVELWVPDLARAIASWGWLLEGLGYSEFQSWEHGRSWQLGATYVVVEQSPAMIGDVYERCRPGLNHLAFSAGGTADVDRMVTESAAHGWSLMFTDRHPHAGGPDTYAAYMETADGFEVELVADLP